MNAAERSAAARAMLEAERTATPCVQLTTTYPDISIEDAYAIQGEAVAAKIAAGRKVLGHKIGLTSKAMQSASKVHEPDYGVLLDDMFHDDGTTLEAARYIVPRIEVELAFVLGAPLKGPGVTMFDVMRATEYVVPALELIDGRSNYPRRIQDNIADNAACGGVITGGRVVRPFDVDLRWVAAILSKNAVVEESGVAAAVLGHPAMGIVWLANKLATYGVGLDAGHFLLAGSFTRPVAVRQGDTVSVDYGPLGTVAVHFH
ncbi:MAG: 2-oxo-hept-4-ene-1,7-dioate hydratase [Betaproteobacteria bacterium]